MASYRTITTLLLGARLYPVDYVEAGGWESVVKKNMTALTFEPRCVCGPPQAGSHFIVQYPKIQTGVVLASLSILRRTLCPFLLDRLQ